jgi:hypothetical protein
MICSAARRIGWQHTLDVFGRLGGNGLRLRALMIAWAFERSPARQLRDGCAELCLVLVPAVPGGELLVHDKGHAPVVHLPSVGTREKPARSVHAHHHHEACKCVCGAEQHLLPPRERYGRGLPPPCASEHAHDVRICTHHRALRRSLLLLLMLLLLLLLLLL